jgi:hypothetical protein
MENVVILDLELMNTLEDIVKKIKIKIKLSIDIKYK